MEMVEGRAYLDNVTGSSIKRTTAKRKERIARNTPESWRKLWEDALRQWYPECLIAYSTRVAVHLRQAVEKRGLPREDMLTFVPWIVENWHSLRVAVFSMNGKPYGPVTPDMNWVIRYLGQIHARFTSLRPNVAASLPLASRYSVQAPAPLPRQRAAPKQAPAPAPAPMPPPLLRPLRIDHKKSREIQKRLGLPQWD